MDYCKIEVSQNTLEQLIELQHSGDDMLVEQLKQLFNNILAD